jgi:hypothetical protein
MVLGMVPGRPKLVFDSSHGVKCDHHENSSDGLLIVYVTWPWGISMSKGVVSVALVMQP